MHLFNGERATQWWVANVKDVFRELNNFGFRSWRFKWH